MFGILLSSLGSLFDEVSASIGKFEMAHRKESLYTTAFLDLFFGVSILFVVVLVNPNSFIFSMASLPTFGIRAVLEVFQVFFTLLAVMKADRSTLSFIRIGTIPLLFAVDMFLGYSIGSSQMFGLGVIVSGLFFLFMNRSIDKKNIGYAIFTSINAVFTISLYKYDISHFNSVVGEQLVMGAFLAILSLAAAFYFTKENPFRFLMKPVFLLQSATSGLSGTLTSFAYGFGPASVILAATRSSSVLCAIVSGNHYFHEKHVILRLAIFAVLAGGLVLLAI